MIFAKKKESKNHNIKNINKAKKVKKGSKSILSGNDAVKIIKNKKK